jgi:hypothetical protein
VLEHSMKSLSIYLFEIRTAKHSARAQHISWSQVLPVSENPQSIHYHPTSSALNKVINKPVIPQKKPKPRQVIKYKAEKWVE